MAQDMTYCERHKECSYDREQCRHCVAERRTVYEKAYMAALGTLGEYSAWEDLVTDCHNLALETVRQWPKMMAELEEVSNEPTR